MKVTIDDVDMLSRTIWGEARGETQQGREAVAWVARNRLTHPKNKDGKLYGGNINAICGKPRQFSCWNLDDPNRNKCDTVSLEDKTFRQCLVAALVVLDSPAHLDPTFGATHYMRIGTPTKWANGREPIVRIGHHEFFKDID